MPDSPPLPLGIRRVTMPLPTRPGHVHAYLLPGDDGWTVVDTGVGLPDAAERWRAELDGIGPVARIVITHFHPDHVGAAADLRDLAAAPVHEGSLDLAQCRRVWGAAEIEDWLATLRGWFARAGVPGEVTSELTAQGSWWLPFIRFADDALPLEAGQVLDGWELVAAPGHADGQLMLARDGVVIGGDHLLDPITPTVGLWPESRPDPLGDYLTALEELAAREPAIVLPGHGEPIAAPAARARAIVAHHRARLEDTAAALSGEPRTPYAVSLDLFPTATAPPARRFAVAETLSHLERLVREGGAAASEGVEGVTYTRA